MTKKRLFLPIASSLMLVACGGSGSAPKVDADNANDIIEYYNKTLEVFRNGYSNEKASEVVEYMDNKGRALIAPIVVMPRQYSDSAKMTAPGGRFGKAVGDSLTMLFREYYAASQKIDENYDAFKAYKTAEDYKDDDWAKGKQLARETGEAAERIVTAKTQILNIITGPADAAEMALMEGNPLKEHILLAKKIFGQMEGLMQTVSEDKVDEQSLTTSYNALEQLVKEGRELPKVKDMDSEMRYYGEYLDEVDAFLGVVRKAQRNGKYTQSVLREMDSEYGDAVSDYNSFVD
ncbi:MAG: YiiG family protein [Rikenellaceae bacterium]|nr:YiiG family protein [Rikenellaceae bacterium]